MFQKNLEVLHREYPKIADGLEEVEEEVDYEILSAKNGDKTVNLKLAEKENLLHSKYNPRKEAARFLDDKLDISLEKLDIIIVMGMGLGYNVLELFERIKNKDIKLVVIEKKGSLFKEALRYNDFTSLFAHQNVDFFVVKEIDDNQLSKFIKFKLPNFIFIDIKFIPWTPIFKLDPQFYDKVKDELSEIANLLTRNRATTLKAGKEWNINSLHNLQDIIVNPGFNYLENLFEDQPVVVAAAGPSLNKNVEQLKEMKDKVIIISVSMALNTLLAHDIIPDIIILIDSTKKLIEVFEGLDKKKFSDTVLAFPGLIQPQIIQEWPGPKIVTTIDQSEIITAWLEKYIDDKGRIISGGSVSHSAFGLAYSLGGNPIIFVGQDLAFSNGRTHSKGSIVEQSVEDSKKESPQRKYFKIEDINGDMIWTRNDYYNYLRWFNNNLPELKKKEEALDIIDATEGGARIEGTEVMELKKIAEEYCNGTVEAKRILTEKIDKYDSELNEELITALKKSGERIGKLEKKANQGLELVDDLITSLFTGTENFDILKQKLGRINEQIYEASDELIFFKSKFHDLFSQQVNKLMNGYLADEQVDSNEALLSKLTDLYNRLLTGSQQVGEILREEVKKLEKKLEEEN